jgi:predicted nuclease with TOPRIM domain
MADPNISEVMARITAMEKQVSANNIATAGKTIDQIREEFNAAKFNLIMEINTLKEELPTLSAAMKKIHDETKARLEGQVQNQKKLQAELAQSLSGFFKLNEVEAKQYFTLIKQVSEATGPALDAAKRALADYSKQLMTDDKITANFAENQAKYLEIIKKNIIDNGSAIKNLSDGPIKALLQDAARVAGVKDDEKLSAEQLNKVLKELKLTQEAVIADKDLIVSSVAARAAAYGNLTTQINRTNEELKILNEAQKSVEENAEVSGRATKHMAAGMSAYADSLAMASSKSNLFSSVLLSSLNFSKAHDGFSMLKGAVGALKDSFIDWEGAINRVFNFLDERVVKSTFLFNKIGADVNKMTGGQGEAFNRAVTNPGVIKGDVFGIRENSMPQLAAYGVTLKELGNSYAALSNTIGNFNNLTDKQRLALASSAAAFKALGVSEEQYGEVTKIFMGTTKMSIQAAREQFEQLSKDALGLGVNVAKYASEFKQSINLITGYAKEAVAVFKELNGLAQLTNNVMSATDFASFSDKFNTLEGAAEMTSKLNAALGGMSINLQEMAMAESPTERIMTVLRAAKESGVEFANLNRGFKQLLAEPFGGDLTKAASFYKLSENLGDVQAKLEQAAASEEELAKKRAESVSAQEKLAAALDNMKIALTPILDIFSGLASVVNYLNKHMSPTGTLALGLGGLVTLAVYAWNRFATSAVNSVNRVTASFGVMSAELKAITAQLQQLNVTLGMTANAAKNISVDARGVIGPGLAKPSSFKSMMGSAGGWMMGAMLATSVLGSLGKKASEAEQSVMQDETIKADDAEVVPSSITKLSTNYNIKNLADNGRTNVSVTAPNGATQKISGDPNDKVILAKSGGAIANGLNALSNLNLGGMLGNIGTGISSAMQTALSSFGGAISSPITTISNYFSPNGTATRMQASVETLTATNKMTTTELTNSKTENKKSFMQEFKEMLSFNAQSPASNNFFKIRIGDKELDTVADLVKKEALREVPEIAARAIGSKVNV